MVQGGARKVGWKGVKRRADRIECMGLGVAGMEKERRKKDGERSSERVGGQVPRGLTQGPLQGARSWGDQAMGGQWMVDPGWGDCCAEGGGRILKGREDRSREGGGVLGPVKPSCHPQGSSPYVSLLHPGKAHCWTHRVLWFGLLSFSGFLNYEL